VAHANATATSVTAQASVVNGVPFTSTTELSHASTLRTMQEIFHVDPQTGYQWLGNAANADDLSELFRPGVIH